MKPVRDLSIATLILALAYMLLSPHGGGGFDAIVAVAVKYDGAQYELTIISDCEQSFAERLERLGELMAEFVREVAEG